MKKSLIFTLAALSAATTFAQVSSAVKPSVVYRPERYSIRQGATINNPQNSYRFTLIQTKPDNNNGPRTQFWLAAEHFGFCALTNFLNMTVNGYNNSEISPKASDLTAWQEKDKAGMDLKLNFDGTRLTLRLYMRDDSPVLWGKIIADKKSSIEPIKTIRVRFSAIISILAKVNKKVAFWNVYERMAITPARTLTQQKKAWQLTPADTYLVLQDNKFDGSGEGKGQGPVMMILDYKAVKNAKLELDNRWTTCVDLELKPDFTEFEFGLWQQKSAISNKAFAEKLKKEKAAFRK